MEKQTDANTLAHQTWATLCQVVLVSNEFVTIR